MPASERTSSVAFLLLSVLGFAVLIGWAYWGKLDVVSLASGEVVPGSQVKAIQHLEGGIIREIAVKERDKVSKGQVLLRLDPTAVNAQVEELSLRLQALEIDQLRLKAEATSVPMVLSQEVRNRLPDLVGDIESLYKARQRRLEKQQQVQRELIGQRKAQVQEVSARIGAARQTLKYLKEQTAISEKLLKRDITNRMKHLELLRQVNDVQGSINEDTALLARSKAALLESRLRLSGIEAEFVEEAQQNLHKVQREYRELAERLRKFRDTQKRLTLVAPVAGVVKSVNVTTIGGVIKPGETLVEIVPGDDTLVIDAKLPVQDIGYVLPGQRVQIDLTTSDAARFGHLDGEVEGISPDTLTTEDGRAYYKVRIRPERTYFESKGQLYQLYPGMPLACSIITGERRVIDYLFDPMFAGLGKAMREH